MKAHCKVTYNTNTMNVTLRCMIMAITWLANPSEKYATYSVVARKAGLGKKERNDSTKWFLQHFNPIIRLF